MTVEDLRGKETKRKESRSSLGQIPRTPFDLDFSLLFTSSRERTPSRILPRKDSEPPNQTESEVSQENEPSFLPTPSATTSSPLALPFSHSDSSKPRERPRSSSYFHLPFYADDPCPVPSLSFELRGRVETRRLIRAHFAQPRHEKSSVNIE